jgi:hypothetical protein
MYERDKGNIKDTTILFHDHFFHSCTVHSDNTESFIYQTDALIDCSKMLEFTSTLKFTRDVLLHVSVFYSHHQGATVCVLLKL